MGVSVDSMGDIITIQPEKAERLEQESRSQLIKAALQLGDQLLILVDFSKYSCSSDESEQFL